MYAGSKLLLQKTVDCSKVFEVRELEEFDEDWLVEKLNKFWISLIGLIYLYFQGDFLIIKFL